MQHRIRAAALVVKGDKILLVKHRHPQSGSVWWVPPGGGLEVNESVFQCAVRETHEETGLTIVPDRIVYLYEFVDLELQRHNLEVFVLASSFEGNLTTRHVRPQNQDAQYIQEARFLSTREMQGLMVFPEELKGDFWQDLARGSLETKYLDLHLEIPEACD